MSIPLDARLSRDQASQALRDHGFKISTKTLAAMASRGYAASKDPAAKDPAAKDTKSEQGPPFQKFGKYCSYIWGDVLAWAKARCSPTVTSTSELDHLRTRRCAIEDYNKSGVTVDPQLGPLLTARWGHTD
jgi:hypothetical protein